MSNQDALVHHRTLVANAHDPKIGRRRVRIVKSDGEVIEGEVDGSGSGGIADLDWGNF